MLQTAWVASIWPRAAEIIRHTTPAGTWPSANVSKFETMLNTLYLPLFIKGWPWSNGNWDLTMSEAIMNIGVFTNNRTTFNAGLKLWCLRTPAYIYQKTDGYWPVLVPLPGSTWNQASVLKFWNYPLNASFIDGLNQEACRDFNHVSMGMASMLSAAETGYIQGVPLYDVHQKRIVDGMNYIAKYFNGANSTGICQNRASFDIPTFGPYTYEVGYNHYALRRGLSSTMTGVNATITNIAKRPTNVAGTTCWETMTHGLTGMAGRLADPVAASVPAVISLPRLFSYFC